MQFFLPITRRAAIWLTALLPLTSTALDEPAQTQLVEKRLRYSQASPAWLAAVGRLHIPTTRYVAGDINAYVENCSATLVATPGARAADTIVTAWHCLEDYSDLSREIVFTLIDPAGKQTRRTATLLYDGGGMHADWAILRLRPSIPRSLVQPLQLTPGELDWDTALSMAGYSRDKGLGRGGGQLTYDPDCAITGRAQAALDTGCQAYKGASGGAVVQLSPQGEARFSGVISAGDSVGISRFVPLARFRKELAVSLRAKQH